MTSSILTILAAPLLMQAAPMTPDLGNSAEAASLRLNQLPIEQAAAPRCGVVFAVIGKWQKAGDTRGAAYPDMETDGGREFFVRVMASLMEDRELTREALTEMIYAEVNFLANAEGTARIDAMMPACLLMKQSFGL